MLANRIDLADNKVLYTLELPSKLNSLTLVENFVDTLKEQYNISDEVYANILTCISEVTNNAIVHGNKENTLKQVRINLEVQNSTHLIFIVSDEGAGFDHTALPDPTAPENLEELTGRGIFIIKHLADQCIFNSEGNKVELHFNI